MLRKIVLGIAAAAALGGAALAVSAPASAQGFSVTIGNGYNDGYGSPYYRPVGPGYGGNGYYGPPPRPHGYYAPAYGGGYGYHHPRPARCWTRPVTVWNGWGYVTRPQRVCR
jgi:hypothetical protein